MTTLAGRDPHVELLGITKHFGGAQALNDVTVAIMAGTVDSLVGENGAGSSTLTKICAASSRRTPARSASTVPRSPSAPRGTRWRPHRDDRSGARPVPRLSVEQNVFLGWKLTTRGLPPPRAERRQFDELAKQVGFDVSPVTVTGDPAHRRPAEGRDHVGAARGASMIIMDEPTAALSRQRHRAACTRRFVSLASAGRTVVPHLALPVRGAVTGGQRDDPARRPAHPHRTRPSAETEATLIEGMLGRSLAYRPSRQAPECPGPDAEPLLAVTGMRAPGRAPASTSTVPSGARSSASPAWWARDAASWPTRSSGAAPLSRRPRVRSRTAGRPGGHSGAGPCGTA